jgi:hypothetical protein
MRRESPIFAREMILNDEILEDRGPKRHCVWANAVVERKYVGTAIFSAGLRNHLAVRRLS